MLQKKWFASLLFTLLLIGWESLIFHINYPDFLQKTINAGNHIFDKDRADVLVATIVASLLLTFLFIWASLRAGRWTRIACFVLFVVAVQLEYGYYGGLGRFTTPEDVVMLSAYRDNTLLTDAVLMFFNWATLPPIALYALMFRHLPPQPRAKPFMVIAAITLSVALYWRIYPVWYLRPLAFPTTSVSGFFRTVTFTPLMLRSSYNGPRDQIAYRATTKPSGNVIFVVDESIRADHLSLNGYSRQTTPYLEELKRRGVLYNWGESSSGATCSYQSNSLLLTGVTMLPDTEDRIRHQSSIFQYAKAAGYTTYYIDPTNSVFWNGTQDDLRYIDRWETETRFTDGAIYDADAHAAARIRQIVEGSTGNFIWINKRGVHFMYNNTYPSDQVLWSPIMSGGYYDPRQRAETVNSYDNGIHYNFESFFHALLPDLSILDRTTILYTADHGQTLAEHGESWSHCKDTRNEARVPIFMLAKPGAQVDTGYRASHWNLFPTLLDLLGFPESERHYSYALSLLRARASDSQRRRYYPGPLNSGTLNDWRTFDP